MERYAGTRIEFGTASNNLAKFRKIEPEIKRAFAKYFCGKHPWISMDVPFVINPVILKALSTIAVEHIVPP